MVLSIRLLQVIKISKFIDHQLSFKLINLALKHFHMEKNISNAPPPPLKYTDSARNNQNFFYF